MSIRPWNRVMLMWILAGNRAGPWPTLRSRNLNQGMDLPVVDSSRCPHSAALVPEIKCRDYHWLLFGREGLGRNVRLDFGRFEGLRSNIGLEFDRFDKIGVLSDLPFR